MNPNPARADALRRLHRLVQEENARARTDARRALIIGAVFALAAGLFAAWLFMRAGQVA